MSQWVNRKKCPLEGLFTMIYIKIIPNIIQTHFIDISNILCWRWCINSYLKSNVLTPNPRSLDIIYMQSIDNFVAAAVRQVPWTKLLIKAQKRKPTDQVHSKMSSKASPTTTIPLKKSINIVSFQHLIRVIISAGSLPVDRTETINHNPIGIITYLV